MESTSEPSNLKSLPVHRVPDRSHRGDWQLVVSDGDRSIALDEQALARLPHAELVDTFTCLAGWTAGPLRWRGVRLSTVLDVLAGAKHGWLAVSAPDLCSVISLRDLPKETLLADSLDGRPLSPEHGGPLRLVIPGGVCYQSVKWVERMTLQDAQTGDTAGSTALARLGLENA